MASPSQTCGPCLRTLLRTRSPQTHNLSAQLLGPKSPQCLVSTRLSTSARPRTIVRAPSEVRGVADSLSKSVLQSKALRGTTEPYMTYGHTEDLFRTCEKQCSYTMPARLATPPQDPPRSADGEDLGAGEGWWFEPKAQGGLGLDVTFHSWAQVMFLHVYALTVRLRAFPPQHVRLWHQNLVDHLFYAAENRMVMWHAMSARSLRNNYLKDLWQQWRGLTFSYDEGLIRGDAVLAAAVWRNLFKGKEGVDVGEIALVTAYLRAQIKALEQLPDETIGSGRVSFVDPASLRRSMDKMLEEAQADGPEPTKAVGQQRGN